MTNRAPVALISNLLHSPAMVGYNRYSVSLIRELASMTPGELVWVPVAGGIHEKHREQISGRIHSETVRAGWKGQLDLRRVEKALGPALWHVLTDFPVPWRCRRPVIVTCHGLPRWLRHRHMLEDGLLPGTFWEYQDYPPSLALRFLMARQYAATCLDLRRADAIICDSEYGRWELIHKFGMNARKLWVVHLAPDPVFTRPRPAEAVEEVRARLGLPERFVLGVASFSRTKNTQGLIHLGGGLASSTGCPPLVLVGPAGAITAFSGEIASNRLEVGKNLFVLQGISDDELACVYRAADVFVNLAWEETFGLPIVEAMSAGTPVVGSNRTAVPEVIGGGGLVVDPGDPEGVLRTVRGVITDAAARADLGARAVARAAEFSWSKAARQTAEVYDRVLAGRAG